MTDDKRAADPDNPRGYYEYAPATRLHSERGWLGEAIGQGIKIAAQLLPALPMNRHYRVIFMRRDLDEVLSPQRVMLERLGRDVPALPPEQLHAVFQPRYHAG